MLPKEIQIILKDDMTQAEITLSHVKFANAVDDLMISIARLILIEKDNKSIPEAKALVKTINDARYVIDSHKSVIKKNGDNSGKSDINR